MLQPVRKIMNVTNGESFIFKFKLTPNPTVHCMKITYDLLNSVFQMHAFQKTFAYEGKKF